MTVEPAYRYRAELDRAIDGDTYVMRIDLGFKASITITVRLRGVDTPERFTEAGRAATGYANRFLSFAETIVVESYKDERSFERWVCDVYVDGESLAEALIESGMGARV